MDAAPGDAAHDAGSAPDVLVPRDAAPDAPVPVLEADCTCPDDDFYLEAVIEGESVRLTHPYPLRLYCEETAVHLGNGGCDDVQRLSGCAGADAAPPCLYAAVEPGVRPYIGHLYLDPGTTLDLVGGDFEISFMTDRVAAGTFTLTYQRRDDAELLSVAGEFRACRPVLPPVACGG